eukprot:EC799983.1.p1 GENE.EC799983.1~~EC799983.1.p1  ORF type:complete len:198 (+),score=75.99 EC799983.1:132-725(+)
MRMIDRFNVVSRYVATSIVTEPDVARRKKIMSEWIEIAQLCRTPLNNLNGVHEIVGGLSSAAVHRLKRTKELMSKRVVQLHEELDELMSPRNGMYRLRQHLQQVDPPCIPYIGLYFTDLVFLDDGAPDTWRGTAMVNFAKCRRIAEVIMEIGTYQQQPYAIRPVQYLLHHLSSSQMTVLDDNQQFAASLKIEPRVRT